MYAAGIPERSARRTTAIELLRLKRMADMISRDLISPANSTKDVAVRRQESGTVPPRGVGTVLVATCSMLLLTNTVSGRRSFHKQSPEFCI